MNLSLRDRRSILPTQLAALAVGVEAKAAVEVDVEVAAEDEGVEVPPRPAPAVQATSLAPSTVSPLLLISFQPTPRQIIVPIGFMLARVATKHMAHALAISSSIIFVMLETRRRLPIMSPTHLICGSIRPMCVLSLRTCTSSIWAALMAHLPLVRTDFISAVL